MTSQSDLQHKLVETIKEGHDKIFKTIRQLNAERLQELNQFLSDELASKYPCQAYVADLRLSIKRLEA